MLELCEINGDMEVTGSPTVVMPTRSLPKRKLDVSTPFDMSMSCDFNIACSDVLAAASQLFYRLIRCGLPIIH